MFIEAIDEAVSRYHPDRVMFDLAAVTFLGSDGIRCLIYAYRRLGCRTGAVTITAASRVVHSVLTICGVAGLFSWGSEAVCADGHDRVA